MSDRFDLNETDADETTADHDIHSTWNTIDGTADVEDLLDEEDLENFLMEPTNQPAGILNDADKLDRSESR